MQTLDQLVQHELVEWPLIQALGARDEEHPDLVTQRGERGLDEVEPARVAFPLHDSGDWPEVDRDVTALGGLLDAAA